MEYEMVDLSGVSFEQIVERTRLVVLECPWENWENPLVRDMFAKMALLKKRGYGPHWGKGMMPVDSTDLVGDHVIACYEDEEGELHPFTAGRSIDEQKCREYHQNYPPMDYFAEDEKMKGFVDVTNKAIADLEIQNGKVSYYSSWTIDPAFRKLDRRVVQYSKDLYSALTYFYHKDYNISKFFCFAVLNFNTDKFFGAWGCERVTQNDEVLPNITVPRYSDYELAYMKLENFSSELQSLAAGYSHLWDSRVVMNSKLVEVDSGYMRAVANAKIADIGAQKRVVS